MSMLNPVTDLINDKGKALTLVQVTEGAYNPSTGSKTNILSNTSVKGMLLSYKDYQMNNDTIEQDDRKAVIRASDGVVPKVQDRLIEGNEEYHIVRVKVIEEAGVDLVYICQVRK